MAIGSDTFRDIGGAVSDIFGGFAADTSSDLKAKGLSIQAQGTRLSAQSLLLKAQGDLSEAEQYDLAQQLAQQNAAYTRASTAISAAQQDRQITMTIGGQRAAVAGAGLASSGTALDLLRDSASQGALARATLQTQGSITEAGFNEQAKSYAVMSAAARTTAAGKQQIAGQTQDIATQQEQLARDTRAAGQQAATGDFISAALKGVAAVASIGLAPVTAGVSLTALGPALTSLGDHSGIY